jgi:hypothetical protein
MSDIDNINNILDKLKDLIIEYNTYRIIINELENIEKNYLSSDQSIPKEDKIKNESYYEVFSNINTKLLLDKIFTLDEKNKNSYLFNSNTDFTVISDEDYRKNILIGLMNKLEQNIHNFIDKKTQLMNSINKNYYLKQSDILNTNTETVSLLNQLIDVVMSKINSFHNSNLKQLELNEATLNENIFVATNTSDDIYNYILSNIFSDEFNNTMNLIKSSEESQISNLEQEIEKLQEREKLLSNQSEEYGELVKEYRKLCNLISLD